MFGGSGKSTEFVRTRISLTERFLSYSLLGLIAAVGVAIYLKGQRYDPGLFALDASSLAQTPSSRVQAERLVEDADEGVVTTGIPETSTPLLDGLAPAGWQPMGPVEKFTADNLYEKIDGRAEQYLAYDVVGLTCASLVEPSGQFIDVFVYDMGRAEHAFGIFSVERAPEPPGVDLGREGYRVEASFFFWKGPYYVQVLAGGGEVLQQVAGQIARDLADRLEDPGDELWGLNVLPAAGRVPGSVQYFKRDALSLDFLKNTYTALYLREGEEVRAFLSLHESPSAAEGTQARYLAYLEDYGEVIDRRQAEGATRIVGDLGGFFDVVFQQGPIVGGVTMAGDRAAAEKVAAGLLQHLQSR